MTKPTVLVVLFSLLYGVQIVLTQAFVRDSLHPLHLNFFTSLIATLILGTYLFIKKRATLKIPVSKQVLFAGLTGILGSVIADSFAFYGLQISSGTNWSVLSRLSTFITFGLAIAFLGEKVTVKKIVALTLSLVGAYIIIAPQEFSFVSFNKGDLFFLGAVLAFGINNVLIQKLSKIFDVYQLTLIRLMTGTLFLALPAIYSPISLSLHTTLFILLNGILGIIGLVIINTIIKKAGASFFSIGTNLIPFFTILIAFLVFKDVPTLTQIFGGVLVIISVFLFQANGKVIVS